METATVDLQFGSTYSISIADMDGRELLQLPMSSKDDVVAFVRTYGNSSPSSTILKASVIPIHRKTFEEQAKHLFLPTFVNHALQVDGLFKKIIASMLAICFDIITCIPRIALYASGKMDVSPQHPLIDRLQLSQGKAESLERVTMRVHMQTVVERNENGKRMAFKDTLDSSIPITLQILPYPHDEEQSLCVQDTYYFDENGWELGHTLSDPNRKFFSKFAGDQLSTRMFTSNGTKAE